MQSVIFAELFLAVSVWCAVGAHVFVAYYIAPRRARDGIIASLSEDENFQHALVGAIVRNFFTKKEFRMPNGETVETTPISLFVGEALGHFKKFIEGEKGHMSRALDTAVVQAGADDPIMTMLAATVPKKYLGPLMLLKKITEK